MNLSSSLAILYTLLFTTAASGQAPSEPFVPLSITESRNAAVGYALTNAQFVNTLLGTCARLDADTSARAKLAWSNWQGRNWPHVEAARGWLQYVRATVSSRQGQETGAVLQSEVISEVGANARATLFDVLPGGEPQVAACDRWLQLANDSRLDLRSSKDFGHDLDDILAFHRAVLEHAQRR